jgi:hypothetical protein
VKVRPRIDVSMCFLHGIVNNFIPGFKMEVIKRQIRYNSRNNTETKRTKIHISSSRIDYRSILVSKNVLSVSKMKESIADRIQFWISKYGSNQSSVLEVKWSLILSLKLGISEDALQKPVPIVFLGRYSKDEDSIEILPVHSTGGVPEMRFLIEVST